VPTACAAERAEERRGEEASDVPWADGTSIGARVNVPFPNGTLG
jgi:hypothetical protein